VRTFSDWNDVRPGFVEADLVAHGGVRAEGSYLYSLVLTDVATGWTASLAWLHRSQEAVLQALDTARRLLPFPLLGLDTDNGSEFLNQELAASCECAQIPFTRGRAYKKNDQCYVEQKNGSMVRALVGYDRFEAEPAYRQLSELYRAVRLYVNGFQPAMKLRTKQRAGSKVTRTYHDARAPLQRLAASSALPDDVRDRLLALFTALDPVRLLHQLHTLQEALWRHAVVPNATDTAPATSPAGVGPRTHRTHEVQFNVHGCGLPTAPSMAAASSPSSAELATFLTGSASTKRKYHRVKTRLVRAWRTRPDPFVAVGEEIRQWLEAAPEHTAKEIFTELQRAYPGQYADGQLRTLQRRRPPRGRVLAVLHAGRAPLVVALGELGDPVCGVGGHAGQFRRGAPLG
jgi:Integrase core domain